jgi:hypothetical protein
MNQTILNLTMGNISTDYNKVCVANQYAMLEATNKLPIICLWLSIAVFTILGFYWIILPFLDKWKYYETLKEILPGFAFAISIWLPLILMYFTIKTDEAGFKSIEGWLTFGAILLIVAVVYNRRKQIKELFHRLRDED